VRYLTGTSIPELKSQTPTCASRIFLLTLASADYNQLVVRSINTREQHAGNSYLEGNVPMIGKILGHFRIAEKTGGGGRVLPTQEDRQAAPTCCLAITASHFHKADSASRWRYRDDRKSNIAL
jgi:hypothetical protein